MREDPLKVDVDGGILDLSISTKTEAPDIKFFGQAACPNCSALVWKCLEDCCIKY